MYTPLPWISSKGVTWNQTGCPHTERKLNQILKDAKAYIVTDKRRNRNLPLCQNHPEFKVKINSQHTNKNYCKNLMCISAAISECIRKEGMAICLAVM